MNLLQVKEGLKGLVTQKNFCRIFVFVVPLWLRIFAICWDIFVNILNRLNKYLKNPKPKRDKEEQQRRRYRGRGHERNAKRDKLINFKSK